MMQHHLKRWTLLLVVLAVAGLGACGRLRKHSTAGMLYQKFFNAPVLPSAVVFTGYGFDNPLWDLDSWGYFTYQLDRPALNKLLRHRQFKQESELNRAFANQSLDELAPARNLPYFDRPNHPKIVLILQNKVAYEAVFFPYLHTIVYDTLTGKAQHFVAGMRD